MEGEPHHHQRVRRNRPPTGDLAETTRDRPLVLDPDLTVRFADRSFGDAFTVTPKIPFAKEGQQ